MSQHHHIARRLMADWRRGQGGRGAKGVPEVLRALEFIAQPIAEAEARKEHPEPLSLTGKQLKLAQKRAISQQRRIRFGPPGMSTDEWWDQISGIAAEWKIPTSREEWETGTKAGATEQAAA